MLLPAVVVGLGALAFAKSAHASTPATKPKTPDPTNPVQPGPIPTADILATIEKARQSADPKTIRAAADQLDQFGFKVQATDLRNLASEIEAAQARAQVPSVTPPTSSPGIVPTFPKIPPSDVIKGPLPGTPVLPTAPNTPGKTQAQRMTLMLMNARPGLEDRGVVTKFQMAAQQEGKYTGKIDGLYGPGGGLAVASYGIVPVKPIHWAHDKATIAKQKKDYTAALLKIALSDPQREDEWTAASDVRNQ